EVLDVLTLSSNEVVQAIDGVPQAQEFLTKMATDKACAAGDHNPQFLSPHSTGRPMPHAFEAGGTPHPALPRLRHRHPLPQGGEGCGFVVLMSLSARQEASRDPSHLSRAVVARTR